MTANKIRIKDIAKIAGVSPGTVDRVLHNRAEVSDETRRHIMEIVESMGYTPNILARVLASKKNLKMAILIPGTDNDNYYWGKPLQGIQKAAAEIADYNVQLECFFYNLEQEQSYFEALNKVLDFKPDGVVLNPQFQALASDFIFRLNEKHIPFIFIDNHLEGFNNVAYYGQNAMQSGLAAARMFHLGLQERSVILVLKLSAAHNRNLHLIEREKGFLSFFQTQSNQKHISVMFANIDITQTGEPAYSLNQLFANHRNINGIFVTNSKIFKVASYLEENAIKGILTGGYDLIPQNIEYLEKGNIDFLIGQKPEEQGYNSVMAMFDHLNNRREIEKINFSPIDIVMKDNLDYYKKI